MIEGQSDIHNVRVPYVYTAFPRTLYRRGGTKTQIDHPGNETREVTSEEELHRELAKGWALEPLPVVDEPAEPPAVALTAPDPTLALPEGSPVGATLPPGPPPRRR